MKVILLQNVPKVGKKFDIVTVSDGFASNMLFPKKLAEPATPDKVAALEKRRKAAEAEAAVHAAELESAVKNLDGKRVTLVAKANDKGHLYKSITVTDVIEAIRAAHHTLLPKEVVHLNDHLKSTGEHPIPLVAHKVKGTIVLEITSA